MNSKNETTTEGVDALIDQKRHVSGKSTVWIICCNDFPEYAVEGTEEYAERTRMKSANEDFEKNGMRYWHKHRCPIYR